MRLVVAAKEPIQQPVYIALRHLIVDLKAEHPALNLSEISRICYVRYGRRPDESTATRSPGRGFSG